MAPPTEAPSSSTTLYITLILFAVISLLLYKFVLSPLPAQTRTNATTSDVVTQRNTSTSSATSRTNPAINTTANSSEDDYFNYGTNRHPPHFTPPEKWNTSTSLSKYLLNGIVPFRSTPANAYETRLAKQSSDDYIASNRKDRARIFARLFSLAEEGGKKPPPNRGANIVVTIYPGDGECIKLQKALMLLGTYYNLFVLVDGSGLGGTVKEQREIATKFREDMLSTTAADETSESSHRLNLQILPPHRIVFLSTSAGRVAFVRQLSGVELIVDSELKVTKELERFGHRVLVYPKCGGDGISSLGKFLIP